VAFDLGTFLATELIDIKADQGVRLLSLIINKICLVYLV